MPFVLDSSVAIAGTMPDELHPRAVALMRRAAAGEAHVPSIWRLEVANSLITAERRGRIDADTREALAEDLAKLAVTIEHATDRALVPLMTLAVQEGLSAYDAAYLDLAMVRGLPLATLDGQLAAAARRCGIEVL